MNFFAPEPLNVTSIATAASARFVWDNSMRAARRRHVAGAMFLRAEGDEALLTAPAGQRDASGTLPTRRQRRVPPRDNETIAPNTSQKSTLLKSDK